MRNVYKNVGFYKNTHSIIQKIEQLVVKSNINMYLPWLNVRIILFISVILGVLAFVSSYRFLNNAFTSIVFFIAFGLIPIYILELLTNYYNSKIEKSFLYFLNILSNFAQLKDDVFFAFEKSIGYVDEPLNGYCKTFVEEVKRGLPVEEALNNFKDKLGNNRFKLFLNNTQLCVKHGGSFLKLAATNLESVKQLQIEKARRKNETALGRGLIYVMMGINIVLAVYMFNVYPDTLERIKSDFYGQLVVLVNTVNLFIAFYLSLKLEKLDY